MTKKEEAYEVYRKKGVRLTEEMSPLLYKYFYTLTRGKMWEGFHMFDKVHAVMLTEEGIIPKEVGIKLLKALRQMEKEGVKEVTESLGGHMHCGEAYITKTIGPEVGAWINIGRSSADLGRVNYRVYVREKLIAVMRGVINFRRTLLSKADEHIDTVMPGYTHGQHAEPVTFGFYMVSWVHPLERDFERLCMGYKHVNISPAGCAVLTTTDFPINRKRTQELLGFDDICTNAKDGIWSQDYLEEVLSIWMSTVGTLARLADDLNVWCSSEFKMVDLPDAFCGTSSIMPQKRNPYGTECTRGLATDVLGSLTSFLAVTKAQSDAGDMSQMGQMYAYDAAEKTLAALQIMDGVVKGLKVNRELMRERAKMFWTQATFLANTIVRKKGIPFRIAHQIVARLVRMAYDEGKKPGEVTSEMVDRAAKEIGAQQLQLSEEALRKALDPEIIVRSKKAIGGTAPERVKEDIASSSRRLVEDEKIVATLETKLATAEKKLGATIDELLSDAPDVL